MADDLSTRLLSPDYATADAALRDAIASRDAAMVGRALDSVHLEHKLRAAQALIEIGNRASVPALVTALEQNQVAYTGGTEERVLQNDLNRALLAALARLTGLDIRALDPASTADMRRAVQHGREWLAKNPG